MPAHPLYSDASPLNMALPETDGYGFHALG